MKIIIEAKFMCVLIATFLLVGSLVTYYYCNQPDNYKGVPIQYTSTNLDLEGDVLGQTTFIDGKPIDIVIRVTGNPVVDKATYYHECYHIDHPEQGDNDILAELYSEKMVPGYQSSYLDQAGRVK